MRSKSEVDTALIYLAGEELCGFNPSLQQIAGLPLLQRQLLWLARHDIRTVHLMAAPPQVPDLEARLHGWRRRRSMPEVIVGGEPPRKAQGKAVVVDGRFLHHPDLLRHALAAEGEFAYVDGQGGSCGLGIVDLQKAVGPNTFQYLPKNPIPIDLFACRLIDARQAGQAETKLLRSFIKPTDGWFSKRINRSVSLAITRKIAPLPLTPNMISAFALLVGIGSGWSAAQGSWAWLAVGGLLYQAASILDGVDGELARAKLLYSKIGEWMDNVCDDLTNILFIAGVTIGVYRSSLDPFWTTLGSLSLVVYGATIVIMYGNLIANNRKASLLAFQENIRRPGYRPGRITSWLVALQPFIKRDFHGYAMMAAGMLGLAKLILAGWLIGSVLTLGFVWSEVKRPAAGGSFWKD
ncbi:MAG: CDP-alcohol phosphatidyltransferase family protein [Desulfobacterales bacterium]|nr:CDP-alcohol phosphatidyltransferase family protein [Desulfobacterales bacterium]